MRRGPGSCPPEAGIGLVLGLGGGELFFPLALEFREQGGCPSYLAAMKEGRPALRGPHLGKGELIYKEMGPTWLRFLDPAMPESHT